MQTVQVIDSHTEGEPTRVVLSGGPVLGGGSVAKQLAVFRRDFDWFRSAVVNEPRGNDAMVGALLCKPVNPRAATGVIFFNNVGYLNACGHGTIGLAATLAHLGRLGHGDHVIETPVGEVTVRLLPNSTIELENVPAYRYASNVPVSFYWEGKLRTVHGDVAWGGNWFYLTSDHAQTLCARNIESLTQFSWAIRQAIERAAITGDNHAPIDHIELFGSPSRPDADSKNFVLCPGKAYDRSPCGTGTSAKMACLYADGKLALGQQWRQESIISSLFTGSVRMEGSALIPTIRGRAYIIADANVLIDPADPFRHGIRV